MTTEQLVLINAAKQLVLIDAAKQLADSPHSIEARAAVIDAVMNFPMNDEAWQLVAWPTVGAALVNVRSDS